MTLKPGAKGSAKASNSLKRLGNTPVRAPDTAAHHKIVALRAAGHTFHKNSAALTACSASQVKRIWPLHLQAQAKPVG
jgi:hypothetical protein